VDEQKKSVNGSMVGWPSIARPAQPQKLPRAIVSFCSQIMKR